MLRKMFILALALVALVAAPAAAQYETGVSPGTVEPGGTITISGSACTPNTEITIYISKGKDPSIKPKAAPTGEIIATITVTTDAKGNFSTTWTVPKGLAPGTYSVTASESCVNGTTFEVLPADQNQNPGGGGTGGGGGNLPRTGQDLDKMGLAGVGLLVLGGLFLVATKRRRHESAVPA